MTPKLPQPISDESVNIVRGAIEELRAERATFEGFVGETLDVLETLRETLVSQDQQVAEKSTALAEKERGISEALDQLEAKAAEGADYEREIDQLREESAKLTADRDALRKKLDTATEELASMANLLELVEHVEEELQQTKAKLDEARKELSTQRSDVSEDEVRALREQRNNLEQERTDLESALKDSQAEVERLNRKAAEQTEELSSYRKKWLGELADMKNAITRRSAAGAEDTEIEHNGAEVAGTKEASEGEDCASSGSGDQGATEEGTGNDGSEWPKSFQDPWVGGRQEKGGPQSGSETAAPSSADTKAQKTATDDPVVGSVLSQLAKLEKTTKE